MPLTAPLDSGLRRNDEMGGRVGWGAGALGKVGWPPMHRGGPALPLTAPLDSGLRRNDDGGGRPRWETGLASDALEALPYSPPPLLDSGLRRNDEWWGPALLGRWVGLRCTEEGLPHPSPPLWIPAFAGMTKGYGALFGKVGWPPMTKGRGLAGCPAFAGMTKCEGAGVVRGRGGCGEGGGGDGDVRGGSDEVGVFALDTRTPYLFRGKVFD